MMCACLVCNYFISLCLHVLVCDFVIMSVFYVIMSACLICNYFYLVMSACIVLRFCHYVCILSHDVCTHVHIDSKATAGKKKGKGPGQGPAKRSFFTISIVAHALKKRWRKFAQPNATGDLPDKYTFSFLKALHMIQEEQEESNEQVLSCLCLHAICFGL